MHNPMTNYLEICECNPSGRDALEYVCQRGLMITELTSNCTDALTVSFEQHGVTIDIYQLILQ